MIFSSRPREPTGGRESRPPWALAPKEQARLDWPLLSTGTGRRQSRQSILEALHVHYVVRRVCPLIVLRPNSFRIGSVRGAWALASSIGVALMVAGVLQISSLPRQASKLTEGGAGLEPLGVIDPNGSYNYGNSSSGCADCASIANMTPLATASLYNDTSTPSISPYGGPNAKPYKVGGYILGNYGLYQSVRTSIVLPNIPPRHGEFWALLLSAYDTNLNYDQISVTSDYGVCTPNGTYLGACNQTGGVPTTNDDAWYVGWVVAPGCGNMVNLNTGKQDFVYGKTWNPNAYALQPGSSYTFQMTVGNGTITYSVYSNVGVSGNPLWSFSRVDSSSDFYLDTSTMCNGSAYYGYSVYEEIHNTTAQQFPNWPFNFTANAMSSLGSGTTYADNWGPTAFNTRFPWSPNCANTVTNITSISCLARVKLFWAFVEIDNEGFGLYDSNHELLPTTATFSVNQEPQTEHFGPFIAYSYGSYCMNASGNCPEYFSDSSASGLSLSIGYGVHTNIGWPGSRFWVNITVSSGVPTGVYAEWIQLQWNPSQGNIGSMVEFTSTMIYVVVT